MTTNQFMHVESRRTFWARHVFHRVAASFRRRGLNAAPYTLCAFPRDYIGQEIAIAGKFEASGIAAVEWLSKHNIMDSPSQSVFVDVGANVGVYTVALARHFAKVVAFEPHPVVNRVLALNVEVNDLSNVTLVDCGLSDSDTTTQLWEGTADNLGMASVDRGVGVGRSYTVALRHGSRAVREVTDMHVALIKIDVEGHEPRVLAGLSSLLKEQHPILAFEANDKEHNQAVLMELKELGYTTFLGLDYSPRIRYLWLRVLVLTLAGIRSTLKPVNDLGGASYSLVFALPPRAAAMWNKIA